jgi:hypothetical protein
MNYAQHRYDSAPLFEPKRGTVNVVGTDESTGVVHHDFINLEHGGIKFDLV